VRIPGDADHDSGLMVITIPAGSRSVLAFPGMAIGIPGMIF
jgi:hypothetical protein